MSDVARAAMLGGRQYLDHLLPYRVIESVQSVASANPSGVELMVAFDTISRMVNRVPASRGRVSALRSAIV